MADFKKLALDLIAADGSIDENEIKLLKKHLYADGKITREEVHFLIEIRASVNRKTKDATTEEFDKFFLKALSDNFLPGGKISAEEAGIIKKSVVGDKKLPIETIRAFLANLKKKATDLDPEFTKVLEAFEKKNPAPAAS